MSNTHIDNIRTIASELSDMSPKTQMEIVKKCKDICGEVADAIETEVANEIADETATLQAQITTNANNIATNTSNIATNTSNIATNTNNIATNTSNIATNTSNIATNTNNIATNTSNIATNTSNIATNTNDIETINETLDTKADLSNTNQHIIADTFNAKDSDYYYTEYGTGSIKNSTGRYASKIITLPTALTLNETCTLATTDDIPEIEANPSDEATGTLSKINVGGTVYEITASTHLYLHTCKLTYGSIMVFIEIYNRSDTAFTFDTLLTLFGSSTKIYRNCAGVFYYNGEAHDVHYISFETSGITLYDSISGNISASYAGMQSVIDYITEV